MNQSVPGRWERSRKSWIVDGEEGRNKSNSHQLYNRAVPENGKKNNVANRKMIAGVISRFPRGQWESGDMCRMMRRGQGPELTDKEKHILLVKKPSPNARKVRTFSGERVKERKGFRWGLEQFPPAYVHNEKTYMERSPE